MTLTGQAGQPESEYEGNIGKAEKETEGLGGKAEKSGCSAKGHKGEMATNGLLDE